MENKEIHLPVSDYAKSLHTYLSPQEQWYRQAKKRQSLRKNFLHNKLATCKVFGVTGLFSKVRQLLSFLVNTREAVQKLAIKVWGGSLRMWVHKTL